MTAPRKTRSARDSNIVFDRPHLVLVEGADDQAIISELITMEGLDDFQVHDMNGKDRWQYRIGLIGKQRDFRNNVITLGLVRDADDRPDGAWDSCRFALKNAGLPVPTGPIVTASGHPVTAILIIPSRNEHGAIEQLCLASFDQTRLQCVNSYFDCLERPSSQATRSGKGLVQVYLGGLKNPPRDIPLAAATGSLDLSHTVFDDVRQFLRNLAAPGVD